MKAPIKVFPVMPQMLDATSYYRGQKPIADLNVYEGVDLIYSNEMSWGTMAMADVLFLQRPFTRKEHIVHAQIADKLAKGIWCDWDDDLFTVPEDNPAHAVYSNKDVQTDVAILAAMADVVSVSTPHLAKRFNDIRRKSEKSECVVIPNALSDHLLKKRAKRDPERKRLMFWRGSSTHQHDLMTVTEPLLEVLHTRKDWTIHFLGYNPFWITQAMPKNRCIVGGGLDVLDYHTYFSTIQPGVTIVPLADHDFNRAKSNIAWIEGSYAHSQIVAPDFEEWQRPGVTTYRSKAFPDRESNESFMAALNKAMDDVERNDWEPVEQSWQYIKDNLLLSQTNRLRLEILRKLCPHKADA